MPPLTLGPHTVWPPVVLAPMAGITNIAFRRLCREQGAGLYVCEMITTRALVERNPKTLRMMAFEADERPRSVQLYGVDPDIMATGPRMIVEEDLADHIDLNFGCPVPKVTRKGGGSALPWRRRLFARIVRAAVRRPPAGVPVTVKMRKGIDDDHLTYVEAGLIAQDAGVAAVALHARTAAQRYSGTADWDAIATLKQALDVPVLGNGDIWEADDALRMIAADRLRRRGRRARLPRPAVAVRRPGRRVRRPPGARSCRRSAQVADGDAPARRPARRVARSERDGCATSASTSPGTSRGSRSARSCAGTWP